MSVSLLILAKALSFIALALLIGSAITRLYLLKDEKQIAIKGLKIGAVLMIIGGILELFGLFVVLPLSISFTQKLAYIISTRLPWFLLLRLLWLAIFTVLLVRLKRNSSFLPLGLAGLVLSALVLVLSFSLQNNASILSLLLSVLHFLCAAVWAGSVMYASVSSYWSDSGRQADLFLLMKRISIIGLLSVFVMVLTGVFAARQHIYSREVLVASQYGRVLVFKSILVLNILLLALANRAVVLPILRSKGSSLKLAQFMKIEAVLLLLVLLATSLLTQSPLNIGGH